MKLVANLKMIHIKNRYFFVCLFCFCLFGFVVLVCFCLFSKKNHYSSIQNSNNVSDAVSLPFRDLMNRARVSAIMQS